MKLRLIQVLGLLFKGSIYLDTDHSCSKEYLMFEGWHFCPYCGRVLKLGEKR